MASEKEIHIEKELARLTLGQAHIAGVGTPNRPIFIIPDIERRVNILCKKMRAVRPFEHLIKVLSYRQ